MAVLRDSSSSTPPPPIPHSALSDNRRRYSRPCKINDRPPPVHPPIPPHLALPGQWVSITAWPSRRLATSILAPAKQLRAGGGENGFPRRAPLPPAAMGSNYRWMPADRPIPPARAVGPGPRAFSRQIASSALESNLLPAHRQTENVRQADGCLCCPGQCGRMNRKVGLWGTGAGVWIQEADDEGEIYLLFSLPMEFGPQTPATGTVRSKCREREGRTEFFPR